MTERDFILKVVGSACAAVAVIGSASFVYSYGFSFEKSNFFMVGATTRTTGVENSENLYVGEEKEKNYQCRFSNKNYDCEIISNISMIENHNKIEFDRKLIDSQQDKTLDPLLLLQENNFFLLKLSKYLGKAINWNSVADSTIDIVYKNNENKKFGTIKVVAGKNNEKLLGKIEYFLAKIDKISLENEKSNFVNVYSSVPNVCSFKNSNDLTKKIDCSIYKYANYSGEVASDSYDELPFIGRIKKNKDTTIIEVNKYYLVGLNSEQNKNLLLNDKLTFMYPLNPKDSHLYKIHFSIFKPSSVFSISDEKKVLIIN